MRQQTTLRHGSWEWLERKIAEEIRAAEKLRRHPGHRRAFAELLTQHPESHGLGGKTGKE